MLRALARQLGRPSGVAGRVLVAPMLNRGNAKMHAAAVAALGVQDGDHVLDVGFGGGGALRRLLDDTPAAKVVGAEISSDMLAAARKRYAGEARVAIVEGAAESLPLADGAVQRALSTHTVYFWPDGGAGARELHRVLAPGGRLVLGAGEKASMEKRRIHQEGFTLYDPAELVDLLRDAGFRDARTVSAPGGVLAIGER